MQRYKRLDNPETRLDILCREIRAELDCLHDLHNDLEQFLETTLQNLQTRIYERTINLTEEEKRRFIDLHSDQYFKISLSYPQHQRKSYLIYLAGFTESKLLAYCKVLERVSGVAYSPDGRNGTLKHVRKYLSRATGLRFPTDIRDWTQILTIQRIRNAFVHNDGMLEPRAKHEQSIKAFARETQLISLEKTNSITVGTSLIRHYLNIIGKLFADLELQVKRKVLDMAAQKKNSNSSSRISSQ